MYDINTHITPPAGMRASELDMSLRETFGHASEGDGTLKIEWNDDLTSAHVEGRIKNVRSAPELVKLFSMLGGDTDISRAA